MIETPMVGRFSSNSMSDGQWLATKFDSTLNGWPMGDGWGPYLKWLIFHGTTFDEKGWS